MGIVAQDEHRQLTLTREATRATTRPPVLLTFARYSGTLAAARCLGQLGIPITVGDPNGFVPTKWSRFVTRRETTPPIQEPDVFLRWILDFGHRNPGHVLYPASDDMAWFIARHRDVLSEYFQVYSPPIECIKTMLDKEALNIVCRQLSIPTPQAYYPKDKQSLSALGDIVTYPVLVKVLTQVYLPWSHKGIIATCKEEMDEAYDEIVDAEAYPRELVAEEPSIAWPMVQKYFAGAADQIYGLSGFIDASGSLHDFRASRKILQYPEKLGVGVCFEEVAVRPELRDRVIALCRELKYWGVFEVEFIEHEDEFLLIDFNPRFFGQMWFDIVRGMPLPEYAYYGAIGDYDALAAAIQRSQKVSAEIYDRVAVNGFMFHLMLFAKRISRNLNADDLYRWRQWHKIHASTAHDLVVWSGDRLPGYIDIINRISNYLRHPRYFVWSLLRD